MAAGGQNRSMDSPETLCCLVVEAEVVQGKVTKATLQGEGSSTTETSEWERAKGVVCPQCHREVFRVRLQDGVCIPCAYRQDDKYVRDREKRARFLRFMKRHNAKIGKRKGST